MTKTPAELSSISTSLDELTRRIGQIADDLSRSGDDQLATELFEVERSLTSGTKRLSRIVSR